MLGLTCSACRRAAPLQVEGTCSGRYGYIVTVMNIINRSPGAIRDGTGFATFQVNFQALVFRPFKDEVLPASVDVVNKVSTPPASQTPK